MSAVIITGWRKGLEKISMTKLIRAHTGLGLAEAKRCTDDLLAGKTVRLPDLPLEKAGQLVADATQIGAVCHVEAGQRSLASHL